MYAKFFHPPPLRCLEDFRQWSPYLHVCVNPLGKGEQSYPDLLALLIALLVTVIVALGVKNSVGFNNVLNVINLIVWVFMMIAGLFFVNGENWDEGRFLPYGWSGVCTHMRMQTYTQSYKPLWLFLLFSSFLLFLFCSRWCRVQLPVSTPLLDLTSLLQQEKRPRVPIRPSPTPSLPHSSPVSLLTSLWVTLETITHTRHIRTYTYVQT